MKEQKRQTGRFVWWERYFLWSCLAVAAAVIIGHLAAAEETLMTMTEKTVYVGDRVSLASYFPEEPKVEDLTYELEDGDGEKDLVEMKEDGTVKALKAGTAKIKVSYKLPETLVSTTEIFTVHMLAPQEISAVYGEELPSIEAWTYYKPEEYEVILSENSLLFRDDKIFVEGFKEATISLKKKDDKPDEEEKEDQNDKLDEKEGQNDKLDGKEGQNDKLDGKEDQNDKIDEGEKDDQEDHGNEPFEVAKVKITAPAFANEKFARAQETEVFTPEILHFLQPEPNKIYEQDILDAGKVEWRIGDVELNEPGNDKPDDTPQGGSGDNKPDDVQQGGSGDSKPDDVQQGDSGDNKSDDASQQNPQEDQMANGGQEGDSDGAIDENAIARATEQGILALKEGTVKVSAILTAKNGNQVVLSGELIVTNPILHTKELVIAKGITKALEVTGTCDVSTYARTKPEEEALKDFAYMAGGVNLYARAKGTGDVSVVVDGRVLTTHVIVTNPKFTSSSAIMYKTQKITVKLKGLDSTHSKVVFSSSNKNVATVTQKGVVKAKKSGRVRIYATVDYKKIYVLVEVSSKAGYQASKKAIAISKTKTVYSQLRRMSKGYYDCSSLVSRVYRNYGVYFGVKKGWSPTAAAIGKWCTNNKKVLAKKPVKYTKLLPGDLVCYSYTRNGRYRNISHIEIYVGNGKNVSASSSNGRVVHYDYKNGSTVLVARPKK